MVFLGLTLPFKKESVNDYGNVLVPLAQAQRHPTVAAEYARRRSEERKTSSEATAAHSDASRKSNGEDSGSGEEGIMRTSSAGYSPYTIEGLRAEVNEDVAASGPDSSYDCMCS